jgi:CheY-like chemotaxis protein
MMIDNCESFKVIMIDDDPSFGEVSKAVLGSQCFKVTQFENPVEALEHLKTNKYDLVLLDYFMPEMTGEEFIPLFREFNYNTPLILQTGYADEIEPLEFLKQFDIQGYFDKTRGMEELVGYVASIFKIIEQARNDRG